MNKSQIIGRLSWLNITLADHRTNIAHILLRLRGIAIRMGNGLGLHMKFMRLLEQIAVEREKELDLLYEIDRAEKQHDYLRQRNLLRCAASEQKPCPAPAETGEKTEIEPVRHSLFKIFGLLILFSTCGIKHKNQRLTVD